MFQATSVIICSGLRTLILKRFHAKDPQIDTYQPVDLLLKRYARVPHNKEMVVMALAVILNHFSFKDPHLMAFLSLGTMHIYIVKL